jgi:peptide/nickel transport system substrate-binding protein
MAKFTRILAAMTIVLLATACAQPASTGPAAPNAAAPATAGPNRLTAAIRGDPHTLYQKLNPRSNVPGIDSLEMLANTGLTAQAPDSRDRIARLAEAAPTLENGRWKLNPDGTMETTWTIREGVAWHDGTPLTADDLVFTATVVRDKELPIFGHVAYNYLGAVEAVDNRTVVARWTQAYVKADELFSPDLALPFPKHRLEQAYLNDKEHFLDAPYWSSEFIGTGPYRIKEWEPGSHLLFEANDRYLSGRPRIDEIVVKFIPDPNTLAANILAGEVDMPWGGRIDIEWATTVADQWSAGKLDTRFSSMLQIFVQHVDPTPSIMGNVEFRRAMVHGLNRQGMADIFMLGKSSVGHTFINPREPEYPFIESAIVKYDYDPRKAYEILERLGYTRGADGMLADRSGQKLAFQIRTSKGDLRQEKPMYASADDWQRMGVDVERHLVPPQRARDAEYRATFPAFDLKGQAGTFDYAPSFHSSRIALPQNNYRVSGNNSRYNNPEMDLAIDRYFTTLPWEERMEWGRRIVQRLSEDVGWIGLYYEVAPVLIPNRVANITGGRTEDIMLDAIHQWEIKS